MTWLKRRARFLPTQQRRLFDEVARYYAATGEPAPGAYLARRLRRHHSTVSDMITVLHQKGFLRGPKPPAAPVDEPLIRRGTADSQGSHTPP